MNYRLNIQYTIKNQEVKGCGTVYYVQKEHKDDILVLDSHSVALVEKVEQTGSVDVTDIDTPSFARLLGEQVVIPFDCPSNCKPPQYIENLSFWLQLTDTCNLACSYCYIPSLNSNQLYRHDLFDLLASRLIEVNGLRTVSIKLAGGEPLLAFNNWHKEILILKRLLGEHGIELQLRLITNLTTLTDTMIRFLAEHDVSVSVSLDGLAVYHDRNRIYTGTNKGTFKVVDNNIKRLHEAGIKPSVMVTVTSENQKGIPDLVDYLVQNDLTFRLADAKGGFIEPTEFLLAMEKVSEVLQSGVENGFMVSQRAVFSDLRTHYPSSTPCSMGKSAAAIYLDGSIYFCHTEFGKGKPLGSIDENMNLVDIINKGKKKHFGLSEDCQRCEYRLVCAGGCPLYRKGGKSPMCKSYKEIIKKVFDLYECEKTLLRNTRNH